MSTLSLWRKIFFFCVVCLVETIDSPAQTFTTLVNLDGTNGSGPTGVLVQGTDGNFYGTTSGGGAIGYGTVFKIAPWGKLTTLHSFDYTDGANPNPLVQGTDGNFYGTTSIGGASSNCPGGCGTVFKITPGGTPTTLHSFDGTDGDEPFAALVQATDGNFYGTTYAGGVNDDGTVFEITAEGKLTTLYSFCRQTGCTDGEYPIAGLVQATDGNFYGTTNAGGANGSGTVFKITPRGTLTTLYGFCSQTKCADGSNPYAGLVQATNGSFYGTTSGGGANDGGTVFEIAAGGKLSTLYSFCSQTDCTDGFYPSDALVQATSRNFYGTTRYGGAADAGTLFKITAGGKLTTLHSFDGPDGDSPYDGLVQATNGNFYGTTTSGGAFGCCGTVFSLSVGLGPFVETEPTSGKVGAAVIILGNNLTGATSVAFNGTAAAFKVVSSSEIKTIVPKGATTGKARVTTPSRTSTSNVNFRVTP